MERDVRSAANDPARAAAELAGLIDAGGQAPLPRDHAGARQRRARAAPRRQLHAGDAVLIGEELRIVA